MLPHNTYLTKYLFGVFVLLILIYAGFELHAYRSGPQINLALPRDGITVHSPLIEISGSVENVTNLSLDDDPILLDEQRHFTKKLLLVEGVNRFDFVAQDKFGKSHSKRITVFYQKEADALLPNITTQSATTSSNTPIY